MNIDSAAIIRDVYFRLSIDRNVEIFKKIPMKINICQWKHQRIQQSNVISLEQYRMKRIFSTIKVFDKRWDFSSNVFQREKPFPFRFFLSGRTSKSFEKTFRCVERKSTFNQRRNRRKPTSRFKSKEKTKRNETKCFFLN